ncbi:MAG: polysaccharide deacetylase family protein [Clostridia bacterium]|nr:polysaccharide deacetylase family protein [Clostridia bacterium]MBQ8333235.1 polysaccharide deacetylase family protein [Clostridia bacterium]MBQ8369426.1 polysaccharide deacetylase family protein [Clostridia bacterium]MBQ8511755.1 polysaccharide deacetylase family protein [Clostridia bacterium]
MQYVYLRYPGFRSKALTLSYDDGVKWDRDLIEIMSRYGLKGTFNINSGLFGKNPGERRMTAEEILALYEPSGNEVAVHGVKHLSLTEVNSAIATDDVLTDRKNLEAMLSHPVRGMAYANGRYDDAVVEILRTCGIVYSRTTVSTERFDIPNDWLRLPATCHHNNPRLMELLDTFLADNQSGYFWSRVPKLFYLWGHSYEFNDNGNWHVIEEFAKAAGNRDDVWYATNMEIYDYVKAYDSLIWSVSGDIVQNPTIHEIWLNYQGKEFTVPAGATVRLK